MTDMLLVFSTFASEEDAARVVRALVEERLAGAVGPEGTAGA